MRTPIAALALLTLTLASASVAKADMDPSLIPDGTYTVKVQKVVDAQHIVIMMDNSMKATVSANRPTMDFTKLAANDNVKMSLGHGKVLVFIKQ